MNTWNNDYVKEGTNEIWKLNCFYDFDHMIFDHMAYIFFYFPCILVLKNKMEPKLILNKVTYAKGWSKSIQIK